MKINNKQAQLQTMETIAVLFVFFILLALAMIFYITFQNTQIEKSVQEQKRLRSAELAQTVLNLPELQKSKTGTTGLPSLDIYRIESLSNLLDPKSQYSDLQTVLAYNNKFGSSKIIVQQIYPEEKNWTIYDRTIDEAQTVRPFFIPVSLYSPRRPSDPVGTYGFGILEVWFYG